MATSPSECRIRTKTSPYLLAASRASWKDGSRTGVRDCSITIGPGQARPATSIGGWGSVQHVSKNAFRGERTCNLIEFLEGHALLRLISQQHQRPVLAVVLGPRAAKEAVLASAVGDEGRRLHQHWPPSSAHPLLAASMARQAKQGCVSAYLVLHRPLDEAYVDHRPPHFRRCRHASYPAISPHCDV